MRIRFSPSPLPALVFLLLLHASGSAQDLPFQLISGNRVVIRSTIGGGRALSMLVDTGTECTVIDTRAAERLQLPYLPQTVEYFALGKIGKARLALVRDLRFGPVTTSFACLVGNLPTEGVDMILGLNVIGRRNFGIDYERRRIVFALWEKPAESVPLEPESPMVVLPARICGRTIRLLADSGAANHWVFREGPVLWLLNYQGPAVATPHMGSRSLAQEVCLYTLTIGSMEWKELKAMAIGNPRPGKWDAVLSIGNLGLKGVYFDFERRLLFLARY